MYHFFYNKKNVQRYAYSVIFQSNHFHDNFVRILPLSQGGNGAFIAIAALPYIFIVRFVRRKVEQNVRYVNSLKAKLFF